MPRIRIVPREEARLDVHEKRHASPRPGAQAPAAPGRIDTRTYFPGSDDELCLFEVHKYPPGDGNDPHAHEVDEIMYVLEGELIIGQRRYGPGSAVYIPAHTLYGFGYGTQGVRYLNFRPRKDPSYISRAEFMERRRAGDLGESPATQ